MARSAKRPKVVEPERGVLAEGAVAVGQMIASNPVLVGGSTAFLVTLFYVSANALWYQPFPHPGAFFATRSIENFPHTLSNESETTINILRQAPAQQTPKPDPVVEQVQGILKDLNFYDGTVDGLTGPATRKAIQAYQLKVGLPGSGEIDGALLDQLGARQTTAAIPHPMPRPADVAAAKPPVIPVSTPADGGTQSPDARIVKIQAGLKAFGNNDMQLDGKVGARTKSAIKEFQALFGLPETGEPDEAVYVKMREIGLTN
ncbi:peptidoglycan-binding protein [Mesorhizobium sp. M2D.F.Ca.ET.185.01.1.1]|uniref:peptidoglycan-binding domain-containing protein n=2 Tax=Mesorhizobium TaxID=68287 RepID=UPI000FCAC3C6|nr:MULTISPECIES: peptidoglycan-binding protein [unclassified Mesorhizobium]TGP76321.1 peptidoglycan-binding protein [bacterium M00.F.Ca.ET.227.01.1.1]TGP92375.1 peptidoglycan-binding protein [bacterium M00.F.Ca.ET.222.01.1.1]TGP96930.1 peptidoglycan-binding protein [bacterium M00.F.Ca.ET.221.01.1.1]TGU06609.1 peptidoglycan-binding protein [bacterium M00.F.Ca.ET.163.01.1.1]TGU27763.1 peptidoglycan-binding protein [bacterium M00.F.Ca.ET.156.01.1.1]TGU50141.1 peptidoglycan-binding protein [bacte